MVKTDVGNNDDVTDDRVVADNTVNTTNDLDIMRLLQLDLAARNRATRPTDNKAVAYGQPEGCQLQ